MEKFTDQLQTRRTYLTPEITPVKLDNEISLALESTPPIFPGEVFMKAPDYQDINPFKTYQT